MNLLFKRLVIAALSVATVFSFSSAVAAEIGSKVNEKSRFFDLPSQGAYWEEDVEELNKYVVDLTDPQKMEAMIKSSPRYLEQTSGLSEKDKQSVPLQRALPTAIDLSTQAAFPAIRSQQGVGSCSAFSVVYYQFTYHANRLNKLSSSSLNNCYSPDWA